MIVLMYTNKFYFDFMLNICNNFEQMQFLTNVWKESLENIFNSLHVSLPVIRIHFELFHYSKSLFPFTHCCDCQLWFVCYILITIYTVRRCNMTAIPMLSNMFEILGFTINCLCLKTCSSLSLMETEKHPSHKKILVLERRIIALGQIKLDSKDKKRRLEEIKLVIAITNYIYQSNYNYQLNLKVKSFMSVCCYCSHTYWL